jgi:hypothetical protein
MVFDTQIYITYIYKYMCHIMENNQKRNLLVNSYSHLDIIYIDIWIVEIEYN